MSFDLEEQEKIDELKAWWARWGNWVTYGIAAVLAIAAGWQWWQRHQASQAADAAAIYARLVQAVDADDANTAREAGSMIMDKYAGTGYGVRAALMLASINVAQKDTKSAKAQLEWAVENTREAGLKDIARLDLASLLLDNKQYDQAMAQLNAAHTDAFAPRFDDLKGDVLLAQGKDQDARAAYEAAYAALDDKNPMKKLIGLKLDALGGPAK
jgi:predicted negative regulator of RcsB-dependent stress response